MVGFRFEKVLLGGEEEIRFHREHLWKMSQEQLPSLSPGFRFAACNLVVRDQKGEAAVGGAYAYSYCGVFFIEMFWIEPKLQRQGLGRRLFAELEAEARKRGCVRMAGHAFELNANRGFWERLGCRVFGETAAPDPLGQVYFIDKELRD